MAASPKTIGLCIFLFLSSALVNLLLKSPTPSSTQWRLGRGRGRDAVLQQASWQRPQVAFATFLAGTPGANPADDVDDNEDGYFVGTRVLIYQLLHSKTAGTNSSIPFLVVCTRDVSQRKRDRLKKDGATVVVVEKLNSEWIHPSAARWADVMSKLRLFQLVEYNKICFIDADTLVTASLDGVFYDESTLTQPTLGNPDHVKSDEAPLPRTYMFSTHSDYFGYDHPYPPPVDMTYLNCGFFVFTPSQVLFDYYVSLLQLPGRFDSGMPEQNLLNYAHRRDGNMPWKPLWHGWNVNWPTAKDWRAGAKSFHAKYWDGDPSHDPVLKSIWREQRAEMEGYYRGKEFSLVH